tara:strand:- start:4274 stop:6004 length:1731 start_codon:yes stop_codon:yes gene_type:complete
MNLSQIDWAVIGFYFLFSLIIGILSARKAGKDSRSFFLAGGEMPWWLLGISMVATTFSTDTPNLVTDLVRQNGVSGNWVWWSFLLTGMLTVFVYAKLWHRSGVLTDVEFYEIRYGGKPAAFLRAFRAIYLGLIFNVLVMGSVSLAAIKFGEIILGWPGWLTMSIACSVTLLYSTLGGLRSIIITDFFQFILAMIGSIWSCIYILNLESIGGVKNLIQHQKVIGKISMFPDFSNPDIWVPILFIPLAVQWWASYYPGSEPGGGGYIAQRMLSAKDEKNAIGASLLFNIAHYAIRPWPWILIALSSLIIFPELSDIREKFPEISENKIGHDIAYPAMLTLLPPGLLGLVSASLVAAFMSTMSTQVNLGASYLVNDFYHRFIDHNATEKKLVFIGRIFTVFSIILGAVTGLILTNAEQAFSLLLLLGSGTGLIYILRWFWWRISAFTEIIAMVSSLFIASYLNFFNEGMLGWEKIVVGASLTTFIWVSATFFAPPEKKETLEKFVNKINPGGPGWKQYTVLDNNKWSVPNSILLMFLGTILIFSVLLGLGNIIYSKFLSGVILFFIGCISAIGIFKLWK